MFSESQKTAYQSVTAPSELREKVLRMAREAPAKEVVGKRPARRWMASAVAACLVLVASVSFLPRGGDVTLRVDGLSLTETATPISASAPMAARSLASMCLPVTVETEEEAKLLVSHGELLAEKGEAVSTAAPGETTVYWSIGGVDTNERYTLSVCGDKTTVLTLAFDAEEGCWTAFAVKE